jgi:predicted metal-dependent phosphoesterase TrpH
LFTSHFDLHCHSTWSDGMLPPSQVVERAAARGVKALALTDHDELRGLAEARAAAEGTDLRIIAGVEVSVSWNTHTLHVVGLAFDPENGVLLEGLRRTRSGRSERAERMAKQLETLGIRGALDGARAYATNPELVSRTHFARYLVASGHARSTQAVFDRFLGPGKPGYVPHVWASLEEAVEWITAAGGLPVLAHPGRYKMEERERKALLGTFRDLGGIGVEVVTGSHTPDQFGYWGKRAQEYGFLASAGSDFHGPRESYRDLGDLPPLPSGCTPIWDRF